MLTEPDPPLVDDIVLGATFSQSDGLLYSIQVSFPTVVSLSVHNYMYKNSFI